jgi:hypothetical protein
MNNLTEENILDYLMTSEFDEGLTPDEFRFLLLKFRNNYRVLFSKNENLKDQIELKSKDIEELKQSNQRKIDSIQIEKVQIQNEYESLKSRKLSLKERWTGKIIIQDNEPK